MKSLKLRLRPRPRPAATLELGNEARCASCGRPSAWSRRWASDWDGLLYCAGRCHAGTRQRLGA